MLNTLSSPSYLLHHTIQLVRQYSTLLESYVTSYYADNASDLLPKAWLMQPGLELNELCYLLSLHQSADYSLSIKLYRPLPLSLLAYRMACGFAQLNVDTLSCTSSKASWQGFKVLFCNSAELEEWLTSRVPFLGARTSDSINGDSSQCLYEQHKLPAPFRRHVTPKKEHEILRQALLVRTVADLLACRISSEKSALCGCVIDRLVVDVGCGQGHLSRYLSFFHGLRVINLEADSDHLRKAYKFDRETRAYLNKKKPRPTSPSSRALSPICPHGQPLRITTNTTADQIVRLVSQAQSGEDEKSRTGEPLENSNRLFLNGLHACGDLSSAIIKLMTESSVVDSMVLVGCCYMKAVLNPSVNGDGDIGTRRHPVPSQTLWLPQSNTLKSFDIRVSYASLEAACHSIPDYIRRLELALTKGHLHLRVHGFRALVELLLERRCRALATLKRAGTDDVVFRFVRCAVKYAHTMNFYEYSSIILNRLASVQQLSKMSQKSELLRPFSVDEVEDALRSIGANMSLDNIWFPVVRYHVLRLMLAPAMEALLLLDRLLSLQEQGYSCCLVRLFDHRISPRNIALVALKR
ncbi:hypothetical protein EG68_08839 [Paragonimus skrjabini miyazakii]|uniref:Methyltransferase domain-containing protein n=1 Tax=Paragonimus skrjabini miyazakii TaxID=59628 RepID=A0A8S9YLT8_9TREM|nr:hypothetical protein EG68_08839 [Paragonimus skrjabini miyazakii]